MTTVLVTGFGPFAEDAANPSGIIAGRLDGTTHDGVRIAGRVLPVATEQVRALLAAAIDELRPDAVVITGVTPGRAAVAAERVAINVRDFPIGDVDGLAPVDEPIAAAGPAAYLSTLPIKAILTAWRAAGIPAFVSNTAGTYVCNQTFYLARHLTAASGARAGLVHIPSATPTAAAMTVPSPSLPLDVLEYAVRLAAVTAATHAGDDLRLGAGATS